MKKIVLSFLMAIFGLLGTLQAQQTTTEVVVGSVLKIGEPTKMSYRHIHFPKANTIIKRGGIANFKQMAGTEVVILAVKERNNRRLITVKRMDGQRFFGSHNTVTAHVDAALTTGELVKP